jgi:hypothetical protein
MLFNTLNAALESEGLVKYWPFGSNINYGQEVSHTVKTGEKIGRRWPRPLFITISVYRTDQGYYESPVFYKSW